MAVALAAPLITGVVEGLAGSFVYEAVNKYLSSDTLPKQPANKPLTASYNMPFGRQKRQYKQTKVQDLVSYNNTMRDKFNLSPKRVGAVGSKASGAADDIVNYMIGRTKEAFTASAQSQLLSNQALLKEGIDEIVRALNSATIVAGTFYSSLDLPLSSIGSSLSAISATLLDISKDFSQSIDNTADLPYSPTSDFYSDLEAVGMDKATILSLSAREKAKIDSLVAEGKSPSEIKDEIMWWREDNIPIGYRLKLGSKKAGIAEPAPLPKVAENPLEESFFKSVSDWATSAKSITDFVTTPQQVKDLDGNVIANVKPMELEAIKNATHARQKTDENNFTLSDDDIDDLLDVTKDIDLSSFFQIDSLETSLRKVYT